MNVHYEPPMSRRHFWVASTLLMSFFNSLYMAYYNKFITKVKLGKAISCSRTIKIILRMSADTILFVNDSAHAPLYGFGQLTCYPTGV